MSKFFSIDRKVILKSAAAGVSIISLLSPLVLLTESMILWGLAFFGVLATYWFVPTWFSINRQLKEKAVEKPFKNSKTYGPNTPIYKSFNPEGIEVKTFSNEETVGSAILLILISLFLVFVVYDPLIKLFIKHFPALEASMINLIFTIYFSTPYLIRHFYCFTLNHPMEDNFHSSNDYASHNKTGGGFNNSRSYNTYTSTYNKNRSFVTNPVYSSLSCNIYNRR